MIEQSHFIENKEILAICPSRERPFKAKRMIDSFNENSYGRIGLLYCLDEDDPMLYTYRIVLNDKCAYIIQPRKTITEIFNGVYREFPPYHMYHLANDDFHYETKDFDWKVLAVEEKIGPGVFYGDDGYNKVRLCTIMFITNDLIEPLGWLQLPTLTHLYGDNVWGRIGSDLNRLVFIKNVKITHEVAWLDNKYRDKIFERTNSEEMYRKDILAYTTWLRQQKGKDVRKIRDGLI